MFVGTGLIVIPLIIGLGPAPVATGIAIGGVVVALALAGTETTGPRGTLPVSAQAVYDRGVALGLLLVALVFAVGGEPGAALVFGITGLGALVVTSITRYSATPRPRDFLSHNHIDASLLPQERPRERGSFRFRRRARARGRASSSLGSTRPRRIA